MLRTWLESVRCDNAPSLGGAAGEPMRRLRQSDTDATLSLPCTASSRWQLTNEQSVDAALMTLGAAGGSVKRLSAIPAARMAPSFLDQRNFAQEGARKDPQR